MTHKAIVFDLDDTLILEEETARASLLSAAALLGSRAPTIEVLLAAIRGEWRRGPYFERCRELGISSWEGLWSNFEGNKGDLDGLRDWAREYRRRAWRAVVGLVGLEDDELASRMAATYERYQQAGHPLLPGAEQLVRSLVGKVRLGLLTNGPSDIQRLKLEGSGLANCFDAVVVSGELGIGKPDPRVFEEILRRLSVQPGEALMIGDSWERDIEGARRCEIPAVWISHGKAAPRAARNVVVVEGVERLQSVLG